MDKWKKVVHSASRMHASTQKCNSKRGLGLGDALWLSSKNPSGAPRVLCAPAKDAALRVCGASSPDYHDHPPRIYVIGVLLKRGHAGCDGRRAQSALPVETASKR